MGSVVVIDLAGEALEGGVKDELFWCQGSGLVEELCVVEGVESWQVVLEGTDDGRRVAGSSPSGEGFGVDGGRMCMASEYR